MMRTFSLIAGALLLLLAACSHPKPNGNTWGDTGDGRYLNPVLAADYSDPDAIRVIETWPADRIVFGTDYPWNRQRRLVEWVKTHRPSAAEQEAIFHQNAELLLGL